jgi:L-alanine-DL-glutamate epimerase-like enolase superfamily enzyme
MSRPFSRRGFSLSLASAAAGALPSWAAPPEPSRISSVEMIRVSGRRESLAGANSQHQVQPLHVYDELRPKPYRENPSPEKRTLNASALYLSIRTADGLEGLYGPIDREAALVVLSQLKSFLLGKDALAGEKIWDQMHRFNRHARSSHMMMAISAVDNTLWDLRARYFRTPVFRLLGGPTRASVEAYGSCLGFSVEPEAAARKAAELKGQGFRHQKWFLAYGPGDGPSGLAKNVELVKALREAAGEDVELMFDAFMGWTLDYAIAWAKQAEKYRPRWIEEAFPPDKLEAFAALRKATSIPVASGEHFYGRWEANRYLAQGALSVVQADPEWCGGVSELLKICDLASLYDAQVIPHGHAVHAALHAVASRPPATCPLVEYLIASRPNYYYFEKHAPVPAGGRIELPERPGFGIEFDESKVESREPWKIG